MNKNTDSLFSPEYEPANADDSWLRHVVESQATKQSYPVVKVSYIRNKLRPPTRKRPWDLEISGRLLSHAFDIEKQATLAAQQLSATSPPGAIRFRGVISAGVAVIRSVHNWDVYHEPNEDPAHSNLVMIRIQMAEVLDELATEKVSHAPIYDLVKIMNFFAADDVASLELLRASHV